MLGDALQRQREYLARFQWRWEQYDQVFVVERLLDESMVLYAHEENGEWRMIRSLEQLKEVAKEDCEVWAFLIGLDPKVMVEKYPSLRVRYQIGWCDNGQWYDWFLGALLGEYELGGILQEKVSLLRQKLGGEY